MADNLEPAARRKAMQAVQSKGTRLERRLFSMLAGLRLSGWQKNASSVARKPDVAFVEQHVAIFVDGCFWHGCPACQRPLPQTNHAYWQRKIERNITLARSYNRQLRAAGWTVIRIWEHEFKDAAGMRRAKARILRALADGKSRIVEAR